MLPILAVVCPPLAVWIADSPRRALANLGLTLLLFVPGVVDAWRVVDRHAAHRRYAVLMRLWELHRA